MLIHHAELWFKGCETPLIKLREVALDWSGGAIIIGPSGSGKTSLFRLLCGWYPTGDEISAKLDSDFDPLSDIRFVGGHQSLLPWLTVSDNLRLISGESWDKQSLKKDLTSLQLDFGISNAYPYELSHGMYKRVEILGNVRSRPRLLLLDEFFTSLDISARRAAYDFVCSELHGGRIMIATHDSDAGVWEHLPKFALKLEPHHKTIEGLELCEV